MMNLLFVDVQVPAHCWMVPLGKPRMRNETPISIVRRKSKRHVFDYWKCKGCSLCSEWCA
jgi:formate hydrogenlyase subunit 6/NADH:ubiquinone oxidoreductase subunit I